MPHHHASIGNESANLLRRRLNRLDAVVHVVRLTAALQLSQECIAHQLKARLGDTRGYRVAILWWGLNRGEIANPREGEVQRARDRRGGEGHHVEFGAERLHALLGGDAEAVLLVDHEQAEMFERHILREQPVGGDHQVNLTSRELGNDLGLSCRRDAAREELELERICGKAATERFDVLQGEHSSRHQHGDLSPRFEHGEGGAQCDLGLAVANIAHDHAIHRSRSA